MTRVVVIGAGLAGLSAALRLVEGGAHVTVVAKGAGSLHLSPGTIDVLGYAPDRVASPRVAMADFLDARPAHPYAHLGEAAPDWSDRRAASAVPSTPTPMPSSSSRNSGQARVNRRGGGTGCRGAPGSRLNRLRSLGPPIALRASG